ncbi:MAG TPA: DUF2585 family protein [Pyrinomonadaceae bacterium]|jgi:hypothetical protein
MTDKGEARVWWPWLAALLVAAGAATLLHQQGRAWVCACGRVRVWTGEAWGADTSQHLFDPYSLTHVLHGVLFCGLLALMLPRLATRWRFALAVAAEALWEVVENSETVINRYREATAALGYHGDTVVNSLGDIAACAAGFWLAARLGWRRALVLFALVELVLLVWIRDSLLLEVLMLVHPVEAIKTWQAGH